MIEVLVSVVLISVGVLSLLTLLPSGWRLAGTSDLLGRAAGILQAELEQNEILILNGKNTPVTNPGSPATKQVYGSGKTTAQPGDVRYTVETEVVNSVGGFLVWVRVTWPGNSTGIAESVFVGPQKYFFQ